MQDPPKFLGEMYRTLETGEYDCVASRRTDRSGERRIRSFFSAMFYKVINKISKIEFVEGARDLSADDPEDERCCVKDLSLIHILQAGMIDKRRKILDMAMDNRILQLEQQVAKLKRENETLRKENEAMRKALNKRDLNLIKNF